ncbi:hypothetical protein [Vibrio vulnificus]|uniref:hypothetical protein n=1 Tax=Vibrio vulnificus TaxID=672 RepID=UPI00187D4188|nr:hypothetical protein [Vibrio vulnificus]
MSQHESSSYQSRRRKANEFSTRSEYLEHPEFNCEVRHSPISSNQCHFFKDNRWLLEV